MRKWMLGTGLIVACIGCCLPLFLPVLAALAGAGLGGALAGTVAGLGWAEIACLGMLAALVLGLAANALIVRHNQQRKSCGLPTTPA